MILSGLYGILIVVLGGVMPLTEIFVKDEGAVFEVSFLAIMCRLTPFSAVKESDGEARV